MTGPGTSGQRGFTLVEMMIALAIGLIVVAAVSSIVVNISTAASRNAVYTRTSQDLRTTLSLMTRELRRAGFNAGALEQVGTGITSDLHSRILVGDGTSDVGDCILFGYDTLDLPAGADSTPGVIDASEPSEWRGFRRIVADGVGVIQMRVGGAGVGSACNASGHVWVDLTDRQRIDVTGLAFDLSPGFEAIGANTPDPADPTATVTAMIGIRPVIVSVQANIIGQANSQRELRQWVRVRAESSRIIPAVP